MLHCLHWKVMMTKGTGTLLGLPSISDTLILGETGFTLYSLALASGCQIKVCKWFLNQDEECLPSSCFIFIYLFILKCPSTRWQSELSSCAFFKRWWQSESQPSFNVYIYLLFLYFLLFCCERVSCIVNVSLSFDLFWDILSWKCQLLVHHSATGRWQPVRRTIIAVLTSSVLSWISVTREH